MSSILREIPDEELSRIGKCTEVDSYSKVLSGKLVFYLLIYGMLKVEKLSQRGLKDAFSSPLFRTIFNYRGKNEISHSSISERFSVINLEFFRQSYDCLYKRFSSLYTKDEICGLHMQRVDSTLVLECGNKLKEGLSCGNAQMKKKMAKYTMNFDGMFGCSPSLHLDEKYASESLALPENVLGHFKKEEHHAWVYLIDRGQVSADKFQEFSSNEGLLFVGRLLENRRLKLEKDLGISNEVFPVGKLLENKLVKLYKWQDVVSENGKISRRSVLVDEVFRVIRFKSPQSKNEILLITNLVDISAWEIAQLYRRRWDIEVFFRFLKQQLNFSHFLSLNENGIQVVLYMTLITAMLIMIYKKENEIGYKTAQRRMGIELESLVMAILVIESGGDLRKIQLSDP